MVRPKTQDSRQERVELKNDVSDKLCHLMQRFDNRLALDNLRLVERYIEMEFHILLHFRMLDGVDFVASIERDRSYALQSSNKSERGTIGLVSESDSDLTPFRWRHASRRIRDAGGQQQTVLVNLVKLMETPERIIPSFVWFERVESFYDILPKSLYFSTNVGRHVFRGTVNNGELIPTSFLSGSQGKRVSNMVKGTSQVMKNIPNGVESFERNVRNATEIITAFSNFQIVLDRDCIWLGLPESLKGRMQILDVLFGPFDF